MESSQLTVSQLRTMLVPLALLKQDILRYLLTTFMDKHPFTTSAKRLAQDKLSSFEAVRKHVTPYPGGGTTVELAWLAHETPGTSKFVEVVEHLIFSDTYDGTLRIGVRNGKCADVVLEHNLIKEDQCCVNV